MSRPIGLALVAVLLAMLASKARADAPTFHPSGVAGASGLVSPTSLAAPETDSPGAPFRADPFTLAPASGEPPALAHGLDTDWAGLIDQKWGPSPWTVPQMLRIFDSFWNLIDQQFACFHDLDVDWMALRSRYRTEIQAGGISRGRFAAIMRYASLALRESHTRVVDSRVVGTALTPGTPLFVMGGWGNNGHFLAGLTPLPDSSLLVYKTVPDHPLGLVPGDLVLGYQGIPWKRLYPQLLAAELPITGFWCGSSPSSWTHSMLMSAGMNWHLFDTIDIVKHATGDTVHLSVAPLAQYRKYLNCTEQLPIDGVPMPDYNLTGVPVSWGIIRGTQVGYVYVQAWAGAAGDELDHAVDSLLTHLHPSGIIFDFRTNYGGNMFLAYPALDRLFGEDVPTVGFAQRCSVSDHLAMSPSPGGPPAAYVIHGTAKADYDRPIAVLVGPGAVSSGDQVANLLRHHPRARFFGRSTSTAFNAPQSFLFGVADYYGLYAAADAYRVSDPGQELTHLEFPVDEPVWLTPDDVARGHDTVADAALAWVLAGRQVTIEVRPGDDEHAVNPGAHGVLPVALLSDSSFDVTSLDPLSVRLAGAPVRMRPNGSAMAFRSDVNGDGRTDLVVDVESDSLELAPADTAAYLAARGPDNLTVHGWGRVRVVGGTAPPTRLRAASPEPRPGGGAAVLAVRDLPGMGVQVSLALAPGLPASLELLDVMGRHMATLTLAAGGSAARVERLVGRDLRPGVYWVRLCQAKRWTARQVVLLRATGSRHPVPAGSTGRRGKSGRSPRDRRPCAAPGAGRPAARTAAGRSRRRGPRGCRRTRRARAVPRRPARRS